MKPWEIFNNDYVELLNKIIDNWTVQNVTDLIIFYFDFFHLIIAKVFWKKWYFVYPSDI